MEAVIRLAEGAALATIHALLRQHRVRAVPMHPGVSDAGLAAWYVLEGADDAQRAAILALQSHPSVDAAMIKPAGEAPEEAPGEASGEAPGQSSGESPG